MIWYRKAADQGYVNAQYNLAALLDQRGSGDAHAVQDKNLVEVVALYKAAAHHKHIKALYALGQLYDAGRGVAQEPQLALTFYLQAAELGHTSAQLIVGTKYDSGYGVMQNHKKARVFYKLAAENGHPRAQFNLGSMLLVGHGGPVNALQAYKWFLLAGNALAGDLGDKPMRLCLIAESLMTTQEIEEAKRLAHEWRARPASVG